MIDVRDHAGVVREDVVVVLVIAAPIDRAALIDDSLGLGPHWYSHRNDIAGGILNVAWPPMPATSLRLFSSRLGNCSVE